MQNPSQMAHAAMPLRVAPGRHAKTRPTDPQVSAARRILVAAFLLCSLAASSAAISAHVTGGHAAAHGTVVLKPGPNTPWMY
jgi:hypothetical protein